MQIEETLRKKNSNLIVYSDVWMSMMDKNLSTTEMADAMENEKYSPKNIVLFFDMMLLMPFTWLMKSHSLWLLRESEKKFFFLLSRNDIGKETSWLLAVYECEHCNIVTCCVTWSGCKFMYNRAHQRQRNHDDGNEQQEKNSFFYFASTIHI